MSTFTCDKPLRFISPDYQTPATQRLREIFDPANLQQVGTIGLGDAADVQAAIDAANTAQQGWRQTDAKSRAALLHRLANAIESDVEKGNVKEPAM